MFSSLENDTVVEQIIPRRHGDKNKYFFKASPSILEKDTWDLVPPTQEILFKPPTIISQDAAYLFI